MGCILVRGNYGATSCAGALNAAGYIGMFERSSLFTEGLVSVEKTGFFNRIITFVFRIIHRVHRTCTQSRTSGDGWQGTFTKMERSLGLYSAFNQALFTFLRNIPDNLMQTLV